jgi:xanthine dehydrogenase YagT iron-sulfur-binding subunit
VGVGAHTVDGNTKLTRGELLARLPHMHDDDDPTRRDWIVTSACGGAALVLLPGCRHQDDSTEPAAGPPRALDIVLRVNGEPHPLHIDARASLLDALRERLGLTGTKKGCDMGQCGACTVLVSDRRVLACLTLAASVHDLDVTTIEGLAKDDRLHPMQAAFVTHDGFQCGFCTPGQIMSAVALVAEGRASTDAEIREGMSGNLCRCGAYPNIVAAIRAVKGTVS